MTLQEMQNQITDLGGQIRTRANALAAMAADSAASIQDVEAAQQALSAMQARMTALQAAYDTQRQSDGANVQPAAPAPQNSRSLTEMLRSNEYARAFAYALAHGLNRRNGRFDENTKILFDALTESGGDPVGSDGGFLVPEDIDHSIIEIRRSLDPLAAFFGEETVSTNSGWRVTDTSPSSGLVAVNEAGALSDDADQPVFAKVPFTLSKYGLVLPVSNELMNDNVANLFAYISRWFAKKLVITENTLLITALRTAMSTPVSIASDPLKGLTTALNKGLDPAISSSAVLIMNQSAFDLLDQLLDGNDRPLLQPDPTNATVKRFKGRPVHVVSDAVLGNVSTASDIFIGDGKQFATLFRRGAFELASTDIGGNAWRNDMTEIRGITRLGVGLFDTGAMVRRTLTV